MEEVEAQSDPSSVLSILTTEHFVLQGARSSTISESSARSALYLGSASSALIGIGFVTQTAGIGDVFRIFTLTVLPTLYLLGIFTFARLVENGVEDLLYGRAINRIRHYYLENIGPDAKYLMLSGNDDAEGVLANMGLRPSSGQIWFTNGSSIAVVNSVVGGSAVALAIGVAFDPPLGVAVAIGALFAAGSIAGCIRWQRRRFDVGAGRESLFPTLTS